MTPPPSMPARPARDSSILDTVLAALSELMERSVTDVDTVVSLGDVADKQTLTALLLSPHVETVVVHVARETTRLLTAYFPSTTPAHIDFHALDTFDPHVFFDIPDGMFHFARLDLVRAIMRDHLDPHRNPPSDYGPAELPLEDNAGILLGALFSFGAMTAQCRALATTDWAEGRACKNPQRGASDLLGMNPNT